MKNKTLMALALLAGALWWFYGRKDTAGAVPQTTSEGASKTTSDKPAETAAKGAGSGSPLLVGGGFGGGRSGALTQSQQNALLPQTGFQAVPGLSIDLAPLLGAAWQGAKNLGSTVAGWFKSEEQPTYGSPGYTFPDGAWDNPDPVSPDPNDPLDVPQREGASALLGRKSSRVAKKKK